jgi:hypothetical protein
MAQASRAELSRRRVGGEGHQLWSAYIDVDDKRTFLGYFEDPEDAARAYDQAAIEYHGEFAHPNFRLRELGGREWQRQWDEEDEGS